MPKQDGKNQLILFGEQTALINTAKELGYCQIYERTDMQFDFEDVLDYQLPEGFHFVKPEEYDMDKISKCCWKGFNHEETEGAWDHQHEQNNYQLQVAPHATMELGVIIADEQGEYACCAGMLSLIHIWSRTIAAQNQPFVTGISRWMMMRMSS